MIGEKMEKITTIWPTRCGFATEGKLRVGHIGAGIGLIFFHRELKIGAGLHIFREKADDMAIEGSTQYADTGIAYVISELRKKDAAQCLDIAIAGGASMLSAPKCMNFGPSLVSHVRQTLDREGMKPCLEDIGGNRVRTMILDLNSDEITII